MNWAVSNFSRASPGCSLGGALRMNAGAMGKQTFDMVEWVRYVSFSGEIYDADAKTLPVSYRSCALFTNHVVLFGDHARPADSAARKSMRGCVSSKQKRWLFRASRPSPARAAFSKTPERLRRAN